MRRILTATVMLLATLNVVPMAAEAQGVGPCDVLDDDMMPNTGECYDFLVDQCPSGTPLLGLCTGQPGFGCLPPTTPPVQDPGECTPCAEGDELDPADPSTYGCPPSGIGDGFIAYWDWTGHEVAPSLVLLTPDEGVVRLEATIYQGTGYATGEVELRFAMFRDSPTECPDGTTAVSGPAPFCGVTADSALIGVDGKASFEFNAAILPPEMGLNGFDAFILDDDGSGSTHYFYPKNELVSDVATRSAADAIEEVGVTNTAQLVTPVFLFTPPIQAVGDGFVADIQIPELTTTGPAPAIVLDGDDVAFAVTVYTGAGATLAPAVSGSYRLVIQVDCDGLKPVVDEASPDTENCAGGVDTTTLTRSQTFEPTGEPVDVSFTNEELASLLRTEAPLTAVHIWAETMDGLVQSNFAIPTAALFAVGQENAAAVADLVDAQLWNPVLLLGAAPAIGDAFVADIRIPDLTTTGLGPAIVLDGTDKSFAVTVYTSDGSEFTADDGGSYTLVVQVDCNGLKDLVDTLLPDTENCAGGDDTTTLTRLRGFTADGSAGTEVTFTADELASLLRPEIPANAVHIWVERQPGGEQSNYATATAALFALAGAEAAPIADLVDVQFWNPVLMVGGARVFGDGFVAKFTLPAPEPVVVVEGENTVSVVATDLATGSPYTGRLRMYVQLDCGALQPILEPSEQCQDNMETVASKMLNGPNGDENSYAFTFTGADLAPAFSLGLPTSLVHIFVETGDSRYSSYLTQKEIVYDADPARADSLESMLGFTPILLRAALPVEADGFVTQIDPQRADRSNPFFTTMESDSRGNYVFDVTAFDGAGADYDFSDWRVEILSGDPEDYDTSSPTWGPIAYEVGSYGGTLNRVPAAPNDDDNTLTFKVPAAALRNPFEPSLPNVVGVKFFVSYNPGGLNSGYSEAANALIADGEFALADSMDILLTPIVLRAPAAPSAPPPPCDPGTDPLGCAPPGTLPEGCEPEAEDFPQEACAGIVPCDPIGAPLGCLPLNPLPPTCAGDEDPVGDQCVPPPPPTCEPGDVPVIAGCIPPTDPGGLLGFLVGLPGSIIDFILDLLPP